MRTIRRSTSRADAAVYRAAAALPGRNRRSAVHGLRHQLRIMAGAAGASPDWATLAVVGPVAVDDAADRCLFEWTASVLVPGATAWADLPELEVALSCATGADDTMPFAGVAGVRTPSRRSAPDRSAA